MKLSALYKDLKDTLGSALEARMILDDYAGVRWDDILTEPERELPQSTLDQIEEIKNRRLSGEPLSRIAGEREFYGRIFALGTDTLDPRPDTEILIEAALKACTSPPKSILDLGTGTGCILITLLSEWQESQGIGVDLAQGAIDVAQKNAERHGVKDRATFIQSNWWESVGGTFDLIVSNPPYIPNQDIANLEIEVKNHDPILALDGGNDGYDAYKIIFSQLKKRLNQGGTALFEIGIGQCGYISRLAEESGFHVNAIHPDLAGIPRVVEISCGDKQKKIDGVA